MQGLWKETGRNISLQPKNILDSRRTVLETILDDAVPKKCAAGPKTKFNPLVVILLFIEHRGGILSARRGRYDEKFYTCREKPE